MTDKKRNKFDWERLVRDSDVSQTAYFVALNLSVYAEVVEKPVWPSINSMVRDCRSTKRTVRAALSELEARGYLYIVEREHDTKLYFMTWPEDVTQGGGAEQHRGGVLNSTPNIPVNIPSSIKDVTNVTSKKSDNNHLDDSNSSSVVAQSEENSDITTPSVSLPDYFPPIPKSLSPKTVARLEQAFDAMWGVFPKTRKGARKQAAKALVKALKEKRGTLEEIYRGIKAYACSEEALKDGGRYAKGFAAWINDDRWTWQYSNYTTTQQRRTTNERHGTGDAIRGAFGHLFDSEHEAQQGGAEGYCTGVEQPDGDTASLRHDFGGEGDVVEGEYEEVL